MGCVLFDDYGEPYYSNVDICEASNLLNHEVRVEMQNCSFNPVDLKLGKGLIGSPKTNVMGTDIAGIVIEVGSNVTKFDVGDHVFGTALGWKEMGTYSNFVILPEGALELLPGNVTFEQAAGSALVGTTSLLALEKIFQIKKGDTVLVEGGSGGIGHLAIQIANLHNARCLCTCSGLRAEKLVTGYGGIPFDYNNSNRYSQMSDFLGDTEVDMLLENSFGHKLEQKIDLMSDRACMVCIGQKSEFDLSPSTTLKMCLKNIELKFLSIMASRGVRSQLLIRLSDLLSKSDVGVNKHAIFPINEIDKCLELYNNEQVLGKIVLSA